MNWLSLCFGKQIGCVGRVSATAISKNVETNVKTNVKTHRTMRRHLLKGQWGVGGGQNSKTNVKANVKTPMEALGQSLSALTRIWTRRLSGKSLSSCGAPRSDRRLLRSRARARSPSFVSAQSTAGRAPHRLARSRSRAHPSHAPRRMRLPPGCAQPTTLIRSGSVRLAPLVRSIQRVTGTCRAG